MPSLGQAIVPEVRALFLPGLRSRASLFLFVFCVFLCLCPPLKLGISSGPFEGIHDLVLLFLSLL